MFNKPMYKFKNLAMSFAKLAVVIIIAVVIIVYFWNNKARYDITHVEYHAQRTLAFYNEDSLVNDLQKQNLWIDLQSLNENTTLSVPPIAYSYVPDILENIEDAQKLKNSFASLILPLALIANEEIRQENRFAVDIQAKRRAGVSVSKNMEQSLEMLFARYNCSADDFDCLLERTRAVPVSLAMAQAAIESGWGASRFARQGNAIYGQWTNASAGQSIVAKETRGNQIIHLRAFDDLLNSVRSYMLNLNTHAAYADFRRARLAYEKGELDLMELLRALESYAEKSNYSALLVQVIDGNGLRYLHRARLQTE